MTIQHSDVRLRSKATLFILIVLVIFSGLLLSATPAHAASFTWSVGSDVPAPQFTHTDAPLSMFNDGTNLWVIRSDGAGTWHTLKGTTMDNLIEQSSFNTTSAAALGFTRPNGDDAYWASGGWRDPATDIWYETVHIEFHYGTKGYDHFRRVGLATSNNHGVTWSYVGDILTSPNSTNSLNDYAGNYFDFGTGDQSLYVDTTNGYFYLYWEHVWFNKNSGDRYLSQRVSRCPIAQKMALGCWNNWYRSNWNESGLGGYADDLPFHNVSGDLNVFYDSYLGKYVGIGIIQSTINATDETLTIATATDLNAQNWSVQEELVAGSRAQWYHTAFDATTFDRNTIGQSFRLYATSNGVIADGKYMTVTFGSGTSSGSWTDPGQNYPTESVPDASWPWNWSLNPDGTTNYALNRSATQSSTLSNSFNPVASKAVDGNVSGNFNVDTAYTSADYALGSVTSTNSDVHAWWQVNLGADPMIGTIQIFNRIDCCADRLSNFYVFVSDTPFSSTDLTATLNQSGVTAYYTSGQAAAFTELPVNRTGQYIRIQLAGTNSLSLAEVEVLSPNRALNQTTASQSSTLANSYNPIAGKAVDGNTNGVFNTGNYATSSVTHTNFDANAWWQVDLGADTSIDSIRLYNRVDCCGERLSNFYVFVSDTPFTSTDLSTTLTQSGVLTLHTTGKAPQVLVLAIKSTGRYVRVQLAGTNYLSLAEVQVWG